MADYSSPKPIDPLFYRLDCKIDIQCACMRRVQIPLASLKQQYRLLGSTPLYKITECLRCSQCGRRPIHVDVVRR